MKFLPARWEIWSTYVTETYGEFLAPTKEKKILALVARPLEWRQEHVYTYADPFMLATNERLWLFFERKSRGAKGLICAYSSEDLSEWVDHGVVLREAFHVSYPQILFADGIYWMLPETVEAGVVWLYRTEHLPGPWIRHRCLLLSPYADPTLLLHEQRWYMWATDTSGKLRLFHADAIIGPYVEHPSSPITSDARYARCGGRPLKDKDGLWLRLAQDGSFGYGQSLHAMKITNLTPTHYKEILWQSDIVDRTHSWNLAGSHHLEVADYKGHCIRAIDGKCPEHLINIPVRLFWRLIANVVSVGRFITT